MAKTGSKTSSDFDPKALTQITDEHTTALQKLEKRIGVVEERTKDNAAIVALLKSVLEHDRNVDPVITKYLEKYIDFKPLVKKAVSEQDREWWKSARATGLKWAGAVGLALISGLAGYFIRGN